MRPRSRKVRTPPNRAGSPGRRADHSRSMPTARPPRAATARWSRIVCSSEVILLARSWRRSVAGSSPPAVTVAAASASAAARALKPTSLRSYIRLGRIPCTASSSQPTSGDGPQRPDIDAGDAAFEPANGDALRDRRAHEQRQRPVLDEVEALLRHLHGESESGVDRAGEAQHQPGAKRRAAPRQGADDRRRAQAGRGW